MNRTLPKPESASVRPEVTLREAPGESGFPKGGSAPKRLPGERIKAVLLGLSVLALVVAACGGKADDPPKEPDGAPLETTTIPADTTGASMDGESDNPPTDAESSMMLPGEGVSVTMARGNWSTGYLQAAIYEALLTELGYEVSDPADLELPPSNAYVAMANGEFDFWANSWFPNHNSFVAGEMADGSLVGSHLTTLGWEMRTGGLQGVVTNKSLVDEHGIRTLDHIANDPALFAIYDAADSTPDDGVLQLLGCPEGWGCHDNINSWIENAGWTNVEQVEVGSYDALITEAISRDAAGAPYIVYTWAPSAYVSDLRAGDNAVWLSTSDESISPTQVEGAANLEPGHCSADPCNLGWDAADIRVTANNIFLAANPAAARLLELVVISPVDVALQNVAYSLGENTEDDVRAHAAAWIAANRDTVDAWLRAAR